MNKKILGLFLIILLILGIIFFQSKQPVLESSTKFLNNPKPLNRETISVQPNVVPLVKPEPPNNSFLKPLRPQNLPVLKNKESKEAKEKRFAGFKNLQIQRLKNMNDVEQKHYLERLKRHPLMRRYPKMLEEIQQQSKSN